MKKVFTLISDFFSFYGICFFIVFVIIAIVTFTCIAVFNPCAILHLDVVVGQNFCENCGIQLRPYCSSCDSYCHFNAVYCDVCGSLLEFN